MAEQLKHPWLTSRIEAVLKRGFQQAYETVKVDPQHYLWHLQAAHGVPVTSFQGLFSVPLEQLDCISEGTIRASMNIAAAEGAGFGLGGILTLVPDLGILAVITLRMIEKLSLTYGFQFNTDEEVAELWVAAASAAGVDISRELVEKQVINRFVPKVIQRIATSASAEFVEKWSARLIPFASSVIGAALNYYFVRVWGERAMSHFRQKHLAIRQRMRALELEAVNSPLPLQP